MKKPALKGEYLWNFPRTLQANLRGYPSGNFTSHLGCRLLNCCRRLARSKRKSEITRPDINSTQILIGYHLTLRVSQQLSKPLKIKGGWSRRNFLLG